MAGKTFGFKSYSKRKVCAQPLQLNLRELTRVIHQMYAAIPQQFSLRHILLIRTRYLAVDVTPGPDVQSIEPKLNRT